MKKLVTTGNYEGINYTNEILQSYIIISLDEERVISLNKKMINQHNKDLF